MYDIEYKGGNGIVITTKKVSIVADPNLSVVGLKNLPVKDAIELATEARFALNSDTAKIVIEGPGEYGIGDLDITGVAVQRHLDVPDVPKASTVYRIDNGDVRIALVGNIYEKLNDDQLEAIGIIDVVIIPVGGGGYTLDATGAATLVHQLEPKVVVPIHYNDPTLHYEVPQAELDEFISTLSAPVEETNKYKIKNSSALPASLTVIKLGRS